MIFLARSCKARLMKTLFISWRSTMVVFWNGSLGVESRRGADTPLTSVPGDCLEDEGVIAESYVRFISLNERSLVGGVTAGGDRINAGFLERLIDQLYGGEKLLPSGNRVSPAPPRSAVKCFEPRVSSVLMVFLTWHLKKCAQGLARDCSRRYRLLTSEARLTSLSASCVLPWCTSCLVSIIAWTITQTRVALPWPIGTGRSHLTLPGVKVSYCGSWLASTPL